MVADSFSFAMPVGPALAPQIYVVIPADLLTHENSRWAAYPAMVLVGLKVYICASESTPNAAAPVAERLSPGARLVFLMTGPATTAATIALILNPAGGASSRSTSGRSSLFQLPFGSVLNCSC